MEAEFNHLNHATWVAQIIGYMKRKSSIWIAQNVERKMRNFLGHKFWARGYFVTTVGRDEEVIRAYIQNQELADRELEQLELKISAIQKSKQTNALTPSGRRMLASIHFDNAMRGGRISDARAARRTTSITRT
jgi:putative transposase